MVLAVGILTLRVPRSVVIVHPVAMVQIIVRDGWPVGLTERWQLVIAVWAVICPIQNTGLMFH